MDKTLAKARRNRPLTPEQEEANRAKNRVRARVEHCFQVLKCQLVFGRVSPQREAFTESDGTRNLYQFRRQLLAATEWVGGSTPERRGSAGS
ncbi:MAG: hypothetical protein OXH84_00740 [Gammaproteobacteria bacterium]|nr:hypothetical protein [Gammaproteobacteria bacterium]